MSPLLRLVYPRDSAVIPLIFARAFMALSVYILCLQHICAIIQRQQTFMTNVRSIYLPMGQFAGIEHGTFVFCRPIYVAGDSYLPVVARIANTQLMATVIAIFPELSYIRRLLLKHRHGLPVL